MNYFICFFLFSLMLIAAGVKAQGKDADPALYAQIVHMDSVMFNAFNSRDTATFKKLFTEDLEFYHDKGGLTGYQQTVDFMRSTVKNNNGLRRDLVAGTLEVYPIKDYGAIEIGSHTFCHLEKEKRLRHFQVPAHLEKTGAEWKVTRVISYDH